MHAVNVVNASIKLTQLSYMHTKGIGNEWSQVKEKYCISFFLLYCELQLPFFFLNGPYLL